VTTTGAAGNSEVSKLGQRGGEERSLDDDIPPSESMEVELDSVYSGGNSSGPMDSEPGPPTRDSYINNPMLAGGEKAVVGFGSRYDASSDACTKQQLDAIESRQAGFATQLEAIQKLLLERSNGNSSSNSDSNSNSNSSGSI
jgi:hypothetical protein